MTEATIEVTFWVKGRMFASRRLHQVPARGDRVMLRGDRLFRVTRVGWDYREDRPEANVSLVAENDAAKAWRPDT